MLRRNFFESRNPNSLLPITRSGTSPTDAIDRVVVHIVGIVTSDGLTGRCHLF